MKQISEKKSGGGDPLQFNQLVRWVNTKEDHCSKLITRMSEYGLCQRCKHFSDPTSPFKDETEYLQAITAHHLVMVAAMKVRKREKPPRGASRSRPERTDSQDPPQCKQNVDEGFADKLDHAIGDMAKMYTKVSRRRRRASRAGRTDIETPPARRGRSEPHAPSCEITRPKGPRRPPPGALRPAAPQRTARVFYSVLFCSAAFLFKIEDETPHRTARGAAAQPPPPRPRPSGSQRPARNRGGATTPRTAGGAGAGMNAADLAALDGQGGGGPGWGGAPDGDEGWDDDAEALAALAEAERGGAPPAPRPRAAPAAVKTEAEAEAEAEAEWDDAAFAALEAAERGARRGAAPRAGTHPLPRPPAAPKVTDAYQRLRDLAREAPARNAPPPPPPRAQPGGIFRWDMDRTPPLRPAPRPPPPPRPSPGIRTPRGP